MSAAAQRSRLANTVVAEHFRLDFLRVVDVKRAAACNELAAVAHLPAGLRIERRAIEHDHRRVDEPDLANRPRKEGDAVKTRGVQLSSESLGLLGVLDMIEELSCKPISREAAISSGQAQRLNDDNCALGGTHGL